MYHLGCSIDLLSANCLIMYPTTAAGRAGRTAVSMLAAPQGSGVRGGVSFLDKSKETPTLLSFTFYYRGFSLSTQKMEFSAVFNSFSTGFGGVRVARRSVRALGLHMVFIIRIIGYLDSYIHKNRNFLEFQNRKEQRQGSGDGYHGQGTDCHVGLLRRPPRNDSAGATVGLPNARHDTLITRAPLSFRAQRGIRLPAPY